MVDRASIVLLSSAHSARDKRVFEKEARALSDAGFSITHVCPAGPGEAAGVEVVDGIRIRRYRRTTSIVSRTFGIVGLIRVALKERPDVYHCNEVDSWLAGLMCARWCGAKVVFDVHEHYPSVFPERHLPPLLQSFGGGLIRLLYRLLAPTTDGLVFAKAAVAIDFPVDHVATVLVRNFPPLRLLSSLPKPCHRSRDEIVAIHTGIFDRVRGWPQLLDALALSVQADILLRVIGEFTDGSLGDFDRCVTELELCERVDVEPWLPFDEAFDRLLNADIGLILFQPGIQNHVFASPHKLYDYMLAGLPVVAPRFAVEVAQIVNRFDCGILVDPSDSADIAAALNRLAGDHDLRRKMGERGRRAVIEELNWDREAVRLIEFYEQVTAPDYE